MRVHENQLPLGLDAPDEVVTFCKTEERAVQVCLRLALRQYGRDQKTVAQLCGWQSDSCLSEIASETHSRQMPKTRLNRFALATGCNLVTQVRSRLAAEKRAAGKPSAVDVADMLAEMVMERAA